MSTQICALPGSGWGLWCSLLLGRLLALGRMVNLVFAVTTAYLTVVIGCGGLEGKPFRDSWRHRVAPVIR